MKPSFFLVFASVWLLSTTGCSKKTTPVVAPEMREIFLPKSIIYLPVTMDRFELHRGLQSLVQHVFKDGLTLEGGYSVAIAPEGLPNVEAEGDELRFTLPLNIHIKSTSKWNPLDVRGTLSLQLSSRVSLQQQAFRSKTELVGHQWIKPPVIRVLGVNLSVEMIANQLIKSYKTRLTQAIDKEIAESVDLASIRRQLIQYFSNPFYTTEDGVLNAFVTPLEISLGSFRTEANRLVLPATFYLENTISEFRTDHKLHLLQFNQHAGTPLPLSNVSIQARIPMSYLEKMLRDSLVNQSFGSGKVAVQIRQFGLQGAGEQMTAQFSTSGSFKGDFILRFTPFFDSEKGKIVFKEFNLELVRGRGLSKTLFSLIRQKVSSMIREAMEEKLNALITDYAETTRNFLKRRAIYPGVYFKGTLDRVDMNQFWIQQGKMHIDIHFYIQVNTSVERIDPAIWTK
jgi:hypothetical protein